MNSRNGLRSYNKCPNGIERNESFNVMNRFIIKKFKTRDIDRNIVYHCGLYKLCYCLPERKPQRNFACFKLCKGTGYVFMIDLDLALLSKNG